MVRPIAEVFAPSSVAPAGHPASGGLTPHRACPDGGQGPERWPRVQHSASRWARHCLDSSLPLREQIDTLVVPTLQVSRVGFGEAALLVGVLEPGVAALGREPPPEGGPFPTLSGDPPAASASRSRRCPPERPGPRPPLLPSRGQLRPSFSATLFPTWLGFPSRWSLGYPPVLPGSPETAALGVSCAERLFPTSRQFHENGPCAMCPSEDPCRRRLRLTPRLTGIS